MCKIRPHLVQDGRGAGLGLSFVKTIADVHGGTVAVHSSTAASSHGSTFSLWLPTHFRTTGPEAVPTAGDDASDAHAQPPLLTKAALVVDDSKVSCKMLQRVLTKRGVVTSVALDGREIRRQ